MPSRLYVSAVGAATVVLLSAAPAAPQMPAAGTVMPRASMPVAHSPVRSPLIPAAAPLGVTLQLTPRTSLGAGMPANAPIALGTPTSYQLQGTLPYSPTGGAGKTQFNGTLQLPSGGPGATAISACYATQCTPTLTLTNTTAQGTTTYTLLLTVFTQVGINAAGLSASLLMAGLRRDATGPGSIPQPAPPPASAPQGVSVAYVPPSSGTTAGSAVA